MGTRNNASALEAAARLAAGEPAVQEIAADLDTVTRKNNAEVQLKENKRKSLAEHYKNEKKVMVIGAPMYAPYFGGRMAIWLNGIPIYVPLDGNRYEIPESYAMEFNRRIMSVNEQLAAQKKLSDVSRNIESYPGEKDFIRRV